MNEAPDIEAEVFAHVARQEAIQHREDWIDERAKSLVAAKIMRRDPSVIERMRELLESRQFDDLVLDLLHAMLWHPEAEATREQAGDMRAALLDAAQDDYYLLHLATPQAERQYDEQAMGELP